MRKLLVHEFITLDGITQAPGGPEEDTEGGFTHGGWTRPFWHDDIGKAFGELMTDVDAFVLGRKTYIGHAQAFEPMPAGDPFGDMMNTPAKYVLSKTIEKPIWRNTTVLRGNPVDEVTKLKESAGKNIVSDGSAQLLQPLFEAGLIDELILHVYPITLGTGKRLFSSSSSTAHELTLISTASYPTGVVKLHYKK